ncbi:MAG: ATP-binding cassette domain-containing protein [Oscillospiraceae bacterium]|nr:ATP-binding cassette domain-containing protein [Candidatus Limimonas egerieequi]
MILEVKDITKNFGEKSVLKGISFSAQSGEALGLLGRNGAGKTTTIRIIMQLFPPNSGEVLVDGKPLSIREINVGYMPEERGLYPKKKIMEQLIYFAELKGVSKDVAIERANKLLDRLQMTEYKDAKLETLSKGNQQKIQLVTTLISNPDIVILDEPFSGLDPVNAMLLKDVVRELIADGKIVIFSSHQMNYIEEFCNNIVIINGGQIAVSGAIKDIKRSYTKNLVLIESDDNEAVKTALASIDFVKDATQIDSGIKVELLDGYDIKNLMSELSKLDVLVSGISLYEPSLSEIFVDYTEVES